MHIIQVAFPKIGYIAVLAGKYGQRGTLDAADGLEAMFDVPFSISAPSLKPIPYFIVTESVRGCIRRIEGNAPFAVSTLVCAADDNPLGDPKDVAVMLNGDMFIANGIYNNILFYSPTYNTLTVYAGSADYLPGFDDGQGLTEAMFDSPVSIIQHNGMLYVSDFGNSAIRTITTTYRDPNAVPGKHNFLSVIAQLHN